ncbi:MAG: hypothetical protein CMD72_03185 [Gammaproteobacteria bacterium]|nr:hypothetical protein [Gammaproteobacteria bacterium]
MINLLKKFFKTKKTSATEAIGDVNLACAILLIEVSYSDFKIDDKEINSIINLFESELKLSKDKAEWLSKEALNIHEDVNCLRKYIKLINEKYTKMQKRNLINMAWLVARADNMIDKNEEHRIRKLTELLHLDHKDFIKSKISTE